MYTDIETDKKNRDVKTTTEHIEQMIRPHHKQLNSYNYYDTISRPGPMSNGRPWTTLNDLERVTTLLKRQRHGLKNVTERNENENENVTRLKTVNPVWKIKSETLSVAEWQVAVFSKSYAKTLGTQACSHG